MSGLRIVTVLLVAAAGIMSIAITSPAQADWRGRGWHGHGWHRGGWGPPPYRYYYGWAPRYYAPRPYYYAPPPVVYAPPPYPYYPPGVTFGFNIY